MREEKMMVWEIEWWGWGIYIRKYEIINKIK